MPKDNIERAIAKGSGADAETSAFESGRDRATGPRGSRCRRGADRQPQPRWLRGAPTPSRSTAGTSARRVASGGSSSARGARRAAGGCGRGRVVPDGRRRRRRRRAARRSTHQVTTAPEELREVREAAEASGSPWIPPSCRWSRRRPWRSPRGDGDVVHLDRGARGRRRRAGRLRELRHLREPARSGSVLT